jgi:hypothetical protein
VRLVISRYIRLVRFSFLILIGRFATLEGMKIEGVTPMHHPMCMGSSASTAAALEGLTCGVVVAGIRGSRLSIMCL